ncbi:MAG TPA: hypothetical protein VHC19_05865 [Pirellulales bacterium]|nr:hypothetical protein [Pirellulales bacterium]
MQTNEIASAWRRRIGPGAILLLAAAAGLLLVLLFVLGVWIAGRRGLNEQLAQIRAADEPTSATELEAFYTAPESGRDTTQLWLDAIAPLDTPQFQADAKDLPFVGAGPDQIPRPGQAWPQLEAAEELLTRHRRSLELMHEASRQGGQARFPTRFTEGLAMLLPHVQQLRGGARLLALESAVEAHRGRVDAAIDAVAAIFAAARSLEQEPVLISQLVRMALDGMARDRTEWLLSAVALDDAQLARLDAELAACDYRNSLRRALIGERVMGIEAFANPAALGDEQFGKLSLISTSRDETMYLQLMGELIAASGRSGTAAQAAATSVENQLKQLGASAVSKLSNPMTLLLMPAIGACLDAARRNEAGRDATRVALALQRFQLVHGRLPKMLDELTPKFLSQLPLDPYGGAPLRYRLDAQEYTVYSIGKDGIDQGGRSEPAGQADDVAVRVRRVDTPGTGAVR